jgi:hypothetical protein
MQDFKYFTYGYSSDLTNPIYGLYQPVLNCFLIVFPDYDVVGPQLAAVLSARYLLQPIRIDTANNYTHNVIDNEVCEHWTISNLNDVPTRTIIAKLTVVPADRLISAPPVIELIQIEKEKQWAQFCLFWLRFIKSECQLSVAGIWIDDQLGNLDIFDVFEPLLPSDYRQFIAKTIQLLYLGRDIQKIEQAIIDIINTDDSLKFRFKRFLEGYNESTKNITD